MSGRIGVAVLAVLAFAFLTLQVWQFLRDTDHTKIALIAETESYAARSALVRRADGMLDQLRGMQRYYARYATEPHEQWPPEPVLEFLQAGGIDQILWVDEDNDVRFLWTREAPSFQHRPDRAQWAQLTELRELAAGQQAELISGPRRTDSGWVFDVLVPTAGGAGTLIAVVNARAAFEHWLIDESRGYMISVMWNGTVLYQRDAFEAEIPAEWVREGRIRTSMGALWAVVHKPTPALSESLRAPAIAAVLPLGFAVAALLGLLIIENGRAGIRAERARKAELNLARLNQSLEKQVAERTRELAQRSADLETITDSVGHDLRNPLNAILVNIQLLAEQAGDTVNADASAAIARTVSGINRMKEILDRLVGLSVSAHATFEPEQLDMGKLVREVFDQLSSVEPPPPVQLVLGELPEVEADDTLVRILVHNLLSNALRYTRGRDQRRIVVSASVRDGIATYCVQDNGSGLDSAHAERIFQPFEKLPGPGGREGMGLGLAIASRVVARHGGRIWADGVKDKAAAVYFTLEPGPEEARDQEQSPARS